jgi:hypothetical protein
MQDKEDFMIQKMKSFADVIALYGLGLTASVNQYTFNGVTYNVTSKFLTPTDENDTLTNRVFRIVENQNAHLLSEENNANLNNEYTCLTARVAPGGNSHTKSNNDVQMVACNKALSTNL